MRERFNDIDHYFETIPWQGDFVQLDRGSLDASVELAVGDCVTAMRTSFSRAFDQRGAAPGPGRTFGFRARSEADVRWCSRDFLDSTIAVFPEDGTFEAWSSPGLDVVVLTIDSTGLQAAAELCERQNGLAAITPGCGTYDCLPQDMQALRAAVAARLAGAFPADASPKDLEFEIARLVLTALDRGRTLLRRSHPRMRARAFANAVELIRTGGAQDLSIPEVCRAIGASERTLRYAFAEHIGLSPRAYTNAVRLARVRSALGRASGETGGGVGDIAAQWGFWHVGQFARDYRKMFGELPSVTHRRTEVARG